MTFVRFFGPLVGCAVIAACSGNIGGGQSSLPGVPQNGTYPQQVGQVQATATPVSASNVATVGDSVAAQPLPAIAGWGGSIAFPKPTAAPSPSPNPKATPAAAEAAAGSSLSVGITTSIVEPSDAPHLGSAAGKRRAKHDSSTPTGLFFISLLASSDIAFGEYPKIAVDVPREVVAKYHEELFALALYDPNQKDKAYRLAVAERDLSSPEPGTAATLPPTPTPVASALINAPGAPAAFTPPPLGTGLESSSLPPERVAFAATAANLTLRANRPLVFALYAIAPSPSPSPSPSPKVTSSAAAPSALPSPASSP
jgi:hypothetical protein